MDALESIITMLVGAALTTWGYYVGYRAGKRDGR